MRPSPGAVWAVAGAVFVAQAAGTGDRGSRSLPSSAAFCEARHLGWRSGCIRSGRVPICLWDRPKGEDLEAAWYEQKLAAFPDDATLLCGYARFQQVVRGNQNLAATLYESALLSDARAARKTAHLLHVAEMSMQVEATTRVDKILRFRSISETGTKGRDVHTMRGKEKMTALLYPDLISKQVPAEFEEGVHFERRGNGFPRGFSWFSPGDLVVVKRSDGLLRFGEVRTQVGRSWQSSFQICVEVAAVSAPPSGSNGEQRKASVSSVRNELASNIWFITPAGYKLLGGRRRVGVAARAEILVPPAPGLAPPSPAREGTIKIKLGGDPAKTGGWNGGGGGGEAGGEGGDDDTQGYNKVARI